MSFSPQITFRNRTGDGMGMMKAHFCWVLFVSFFVFGTSGCDTTKDQPRTSQPETGAEQSGAGENERSQGDGSQTASGQRAWNLLQQGKLDEARSLAQRVLIESPEDKVALQTMASIHASQGNFADAAGIARTLGKLNGGGSVEDWLTAFDWHLRAGELAAAEEDLQEAIRVAPDDPRTHRTMAQLLNAEGRRFESRPFILNLIRLNAAQPRELLSLVELGSPFMLVSLDEVVGDPANTLLELGKARYLLVADSNAEAALEKVNCLASNVSHPALDAFRGRLIAETADDDAFKKWLETVTPGTEKQPEYWSAIGQRLIRLGRDKEAIRALGEAVKLDPTDRASLRLLAAALERTGDDENAAASRKNLATLDQLFRIAAVADQSQVMWIGQQLQTLVRPWESLGWYQHALQMQGGDPRSSSQLSERLDQIAAWEKTGTSEAVLQSRFDRLVGIDLAKYPTPSLEGIELTEPTVQPGQQTQRDLAFRNIADQLGIDVDFTSEYPTEEVDFFLYQANGGGLATFDYDLDGMCDLYVVQTGGDPQELDSSEPNQLFRQLPGGNFQAIEKLAAVADRRYGQGVCAGDINQDGFTDLIVANIGKNSVYVNQGDGTFRKDAFAITASDGRWTSSIGLADMNGDHLPDVIEVNYLNDPLIFQRKCQGKRLDCTPQRFRAASDRIFENRGDGTYVVAPTGSGSMEASPNYGFGLIVTTFGQTGGNEIFVSNDGDLNHFWKSLPADSGDRSGWKLSESAGVSGCSIGASGISQACMGIAASDFDRNGYIDLGVTNFHNEPMNLFLQNKAGFFTDEALRFGLGENSKDMLGFGTQAADFDNDGWADIAVLNGHIYDARYAEIPFAMQPQLFRGGKSGFKLQSSARLSEYWQRPQLGRTLAMLDWNRDGKMDLLANHLDQPLALLQNESDSGNWLQVELVGTMSEREAVGARIEVESGEQSWVGWQIAGDGYMCTNESLIHLGLGSHDVIDRLTVHWPATDPQVFEQVPVNQRYLLIEGQSSITTR
jgi:tetratricopeptide (TPR) repeat protein